MNKSTIIVILLASIVSLSVISQSPILGNAKDAYYVDYALVLYLAILISLSYQGLDLKALLVPFISIALLLLYYLSMALLIDKIYIHGYYLRYILLSYTMVVTGYLSGSMLNDKQSEFVVFIYVILTFLNGILAYTEFIGNINYWYITPQYLYGSKNSLGVQLGLAIICVYCFFMKRKFTSVAISLVIIFIMLMIRSRAAILGLIVCLIIQQASELKKGRKYPIALMALLLIAIGLFPRVSDMVYQAFGLRRGVQLSLDEFSSYRIQGILNSIEIFKKNIAFGVGKYYVDMMLISLGVESGIIGIAIVITYLANISRFIFKRYQIRNKIGLKSLHTFILFSALYLMFVSLFEGLLPFGPGNVTIIFWLFLGIWMKKSRELLTNNGDSSS